MILKNKKNIYAAKARVGLLSAYAAQLIVSNLGNSGFDKIFTPKGLNFSSLYQNANFSSNASNSTVAKAISNKAITPSLTSSRSLIINQPIKKKFHFFFSPILALANKKLLAYNFLANTNISSLKKKNVAIVYSEDIIKLISAFFKSIYCLISRPKFINTPDKIIIEILYYITIPDHNVFKWYNFIYSCASANNSLNKLNSNLAYARISTKGPTQVKKKPTIKTILFKNFLIKKTLFKLNNTNIVNLYINKFNILFKLLQGQYLVAPALVKKKSPTFLGSSGCVSWQNKPIEFNLIRLHKSDYDSNILAQLFILILKKKNIRIAINKLYTKNNIAVANATAKNSYLMQSQAQEHNFIPAYISGLYIKIGGRLMREPIIPRVTNKKFEIGAIATGKVNLVDSARITNKNKKGAYTIKITYAQNFVF
jgi:hypothetical protein